MTYIRECQALMSLRLLNPTLRDAVLTMRPTTSASSSSTTITPVAPAVPLSGSAKGSSSTSSVTAARQRAASDISAISAASSTTAGGDDDAMSSTPIGLPHKLWKALRKEYNDSQLRAIRSVCRRERLAALQQSAAGGSSSTVAPGSSSLCLLQGPPGTGKTKTILGLLSILLAGALKDASKSTKVIAGASLRSTASAEAAALAAKNKAKGKGTTSKVEILTRPRSDSITSDGGGSSSGVTGNGRNSDRPRVLVCAPSNTAVDELVFRIVTQVSECSIITSHSVILTLSVSVGYIR